MKKTSVAILLSSISVFSTGVSAGIPTIDPGAIAQTALVLVEAREQLVQLKAQIKDDIRRLEGYEYDYDVFGSSGAYTRDSIDDLDIDSATVEDYLRSNGYKYKIDSDLQKQYEAQAKRVKQLEAAKARLEIQAEKYDELQSKFASAKTPKEREIISNTIQLENLKAQNAYKAVEFEMNMQKQENELKEKELLGEHMKKSMAAPEINGRFSISK